MKPEESYLKLLMALLYGSENPEQKVQELKSRISNSGVCAKNIKEGMVSCRCEDCEVDPTCMICDACFKKGDHEGHRVWFKTNVWGVCDCGDPEAWKESGFCSDHKGFANSIDQVLNQLPKYVQESAPVCFEWLSCHLKSLLLKLSQETHMPLNTE